MSSGVLQRKGYAKGRPAENGLKPTRLKEALLIDLTFEPAGAIAGTRSARLKGLRNRSRLNFINRINMLLVTFPSLEAHDSSKVNSINTMYMLYTVFVIAAIDMVYIV